MSFWDEMGYGDDSDREMTRVFFHLWKHANDSCVSMPDYKDMPWIVETDQFNVWVLDSSSQQWPTDQLVHLRNMAELMDEPEKSLQLGWIDGKTVCTYIALGVGQLFHGFPLLNHFGVDHDPLWTQFKRKGNAFVTVAENYHVSLAICGGFPNAIDRIRLQESLQSEVVNKYFALRSAPHDRPFKLLWFKSVWLVGDGERSVNGLTVNCEVRPLHVFPYENLARLIKNEDILPLGATTDEEDRDLLKAWQRYHKRDKERIDLAQSFRAQELPSTEEAVPFTLISKVFEGLGFGDEIREICFYLSQRLEFQHQIHYKARANKSGAFIANETNWHLSRQGDGEIFSVNIPACSVRRDHHGNIIHPAAGSSAQSSTDVPHAAAGSSAQSSTDVPHVPPVKYETEETLMQWAEQILKPREQFDAYITSLSVNGQVFFEEALTLDQEDFRREMANNLRPLESNLIAYWAQFNAKQVGINEFAEYINWEVVKYPNSKPLKEYLRFLPKVIHVDLLKRGWIVFLTEHTWLQFN